MTHRNTGKKLKKSIYIMIAFLLFIPSWVNAEISNVIPTDISYTTALIQWDTSESANESRVEYDSTNSTPPFDYSTAKKTTDARGTQHGYSVGGLKPNTLYYYRVCSTSSAEECSDVHSFSTLSEPPDRFDPPTLPDSPELEAMPAIDGDTFTVEDDCSNLQDVLDEAASLTGAANHQILIPPEATCLGNYTLPTRSGAGWIVVRSSVEDTKLPAEGVRISPAYESVIPTLKVGSISRNGAIYSDNTSKWRFVGLRFTADSATDRVSLIRILPGTSDIVFDRNVFAFEGTVGTSGDAFGLWLRGTRMIAANNYIRIIALNRLAYAIEPTYAQGLTIDNNYINAPGISIFGEAGDGHNPCSDVTITRNLFEWEKAYDDLTSNVRQNIEFKAVKRILIEGNIIRHQWSDGVTANFTNPILFSPRNNDATTPIPDSENEIHDVTIINNILYDVPGGISVMGSEKPSFAIDVPATKRVLIRNNLFYDSSGADYGMRGSPFYFGRSLEDIVVEHNTIFDPRGTRPWIIYWNGGRGAGLKVKCNILGQNILPSESPGLCFQIETDGFLPAVPSESSPLIDILHSAIHAAPFFDPTMEYIDNLIIPGVTNSLDDENYDDPSYNLSTTVCQNYWNSVPGNTCAGNDSTMDTANERFASIGFTAYPPVSAEDFALASTSPYKDICADGRDPGADIAEILAAIEGVDSGSSTGVMVKGGCGSTVDRSPASTMSALSLVLVLSLSFLFRRRGSRK